MTIKTIERVIAKLSPKQLIAFRAWFYKFDARIWDGQFMEDAKEGRLDSVAHKAIKNFEKGMK